MNLSEFKNIKIVPILESLTVLDISDEEYFSSEYKKYISNSSLSLINPEQGGSPQMYYEGLSAHQKYMDSMVFGSAVHQLVLQPNDFTLIESVDRPTAKAGFMADELYSNFIKFGIVTVDDIIKASDKINYYKGKMDDKKIEALREKFEPYHNQRKTYESSSLFKLDSKEPIYLDPKSRFKLKECLKSVNKNSDIQELLHPKGLVIDPESSNEICILLDVKAIYPDGKERILSLKAKIDNFTFDSEANIVTLNDLKTTGHDISEFKNSFFKYHYYRQMAMYGWMLFLLLGIKEKITMKSNMLLVSTIPPYNSGVFKVTDVSIRQGMEEFSELLKRVAFHEEYGYDIT